MEGLGSSIPVHTLEWVEVESSNVEAVAFYRPQRATDPDMMVVRFLNGAQYVYFPVSFEEYHSLINAPSVGVFLNAHIKPHKACMRISQ